ncbi:ImmA/IrrE family metallo-endopeptidase [Clostridium sp. AF27-5AA]|uniref:ImmA/IrrE family metallo-endopeptidase n=1 Tax=Clostridium sp. AF27-5AA TaxID=2293008 RepID=UPI0011C21D3D|nr:ImmA/IrrE family metallo-endopeptidase [Clostridium sp. AF27-5AA]
MNTCAIDMADAVVRRYKTRDPEEIISRRAINLKEIRYCHDLLGYYTVLLNCEYIGINSNCTNAQRVSAMAHELGHALFDRKHASSGQAFQDTYFYSLDNSKAERRANTFAAELLLADDAVLEPIGYYEYAADQKQLEANLPSRCSSAYRAMKYQELLQEFQYAHSGLVTLDEIARMNSIEKHFVDFKLNILADKGYQLPFLPELHNDFLKNSMKNCNEGEVTMD